MVKSGFILQGIITLAGLLFIWYLISRTGRRSIKTGKSPGAEKI
jgi:hypothetical protein